MNAPPEAPAPAGHTSPADERTGPLCLVTGASGFVGHQLVERLVPEAVRIRATVRDRSRFDPPSGSGVGVVEADLQRAETLPAAVAGVDVLYYLVHSMGSGGDLAEEDRAAAENLADAARRAGVRRIVYLGAVGYDPDEDSSAHLRSRHEVEGILATAVPELVVVRASMAVGAGSGSFRTLLQIVERMPALVLPPWRSSRSEPIAIDDLLRCLVVARHVPPGRYDVAGPDVLTVEQMTRVLAELLGKPFRAVPVPISVPGVEGAIASAITDEDRDLITLLLEGLHDDLLVDDNAALPVFGVDPIPFRQAASDAIARIAAE